MAEAFKINKVTFIDGQTATCTVHYYEGCEQSKIDIAIEEFTPSAKKLNTAEFFPSSSDETYEVRAGLKVIRLKADNLAEAKDWYSKNTKTESQTSK